ncbi:hypothetical protein [Embleya hyalina]|uniref:Uncharacterized protein n=1 Tax=Embleya hyalina TaxID=516124 RepID=A0A401YWK4_9ACTN|nr:hypothetical protein [Embleya hyalina]GCD99003.1 hypothetical protein EHYA_06715 [Embleya hyalina]
MSLAVQLAVEESKVTPGLLGFVVVAFLAVATWLLLKSMNTRLKRVDFDESPNPTDPARTGAAQKKEDNGAPVA